jgi:hypothetical protein
MALFQWLAFHPPNLWISLWATTGAKAFLHVQQGSFYKLPIFWAVFQGAEI